MTFAEQFQAARAASGLSQSQAALAIGRSVRTLQNWERAANTPHSTIQAASLAALRSPKRPRKQKGQNAKAHPTAATTKDAANIKPTRTTSGRSMNTTTITASE